MGVTRRAFWLAASAAAGAAGMRWLGPRAPVLAGNPIVAPSAVAGVLNDASLLSETPVFRHMLVEEDPGEALVVRLRAELKEAAAANRPVNIGAARHSMGGQAIPRDGHALTFASRFIEPDLRAGLYRVHAGMRWADVILALDWLGFSPKVMQSNNDFGVAATFSVNAHGWPVTHGPMGATVREVTMVLADGTLVTASREKEPQLFHAAMGGYGLIGLITELVVEMVPNQNLEPQFVEMPAEDFAGAFTTALADPQVSMAYGRLNVDRSRFFRDALLIAYRPADDQSNIAPASGSGLVSKVSRHIFRGQLGNETVKSLRWEIETGLGPRIANIATRNTLINEPVVTLDDRDPARTDILHEYFVAPDRFAEFLQVCRAVIPASYQELLNVTLRYVDADPASMLSYAPVPRIAAVMLFSQEMTERGEADMARMTRKLIEGVIGIGGSYYLPYRPHATQDQFRRAYPQAVAFAALKRQVDPGLRLRNALWDGYLEQL